MTDKKGSKKQVLKGEKLHTSGNLTAADLKVSKKRKVVSKARSEASKGNPWIEAVQAARKELKITGWEVPRKGAPKDSDSKKLYDKAKEIHEKSKTKTK